MTIRTEIAEQLLRPKSVDAIIAAIEKALPEKKPPSDPKWHNKKHKPEPKPRRQPQPDDDPDWPYGSVPPKSVQVLRTPNDGFNDAIDQVKAILNERDEDAV